MKKKYIHIAVVGSNFDQINSWIHHYGVKDKRKQVKYIKVSRFYHTVGMQIDSFVLTNSVREMGENGTEIIDSLRLCLLTTNNQARGSKLAARS